MLSIIFIIPVLIIIIISVVIVKIAAVALTMTGMSERKASFQALSAFTGTGFTTRDSELIMQDGLRKQIISFLMILGNAGHVTVITTLILTFAQSGVKPTLINSAILVFGLLIIYKITTFKRFTRFFAKKIEARLQKKDAFKRMPVEEIRLVSSEYGIAEITIKESFADLGKTLERSLFRQKDILVLAIEKKSGIIPTPKATDIIEKGDILVCYGRLDNIEKLI